MKRKTIPGQIFLYLFFIPVLFLVSCSDNSNDSDSLQSVFPKKVPQSLTYDTVSIILVDMKLYADGVKKLDQKTVQTLDSNYKDVLFEIERDPLFLNVYPDAPNSKVVFLLVPKDPATGAGYLVTFDQKLPVVDADTVELQVRTKYSEKPLTCSMQVPDPAAYMAEYSLHKINVRITVSKRYLQSGTYDFDALTIPSYRTRGYPFIVFDFVSAQVEDRTTGVNAACVQ